jgi:TRAP-type C4-dicarboxylate transport system permease small subunit
MFKKVIEKFLEVITILGMVLLVIFALWQVFSRYILNDPSTFTDEFLRYAMIWTSMLGAAYVFGQRKHLALVFLRHKLHGKQRAVLMFFTDIIVILFAAGIMVYGGSFLASRTIYEITPVLSLSMGKVYSIIPIAGALIIILKLIDLGGDIKKFIKGNV